MKWPPLRWDGRTLAAVAAMLALAAACFNYADRAAPNRKAQERLATAWAENKAPHWRTVTRVWLPRAAFINGWIFLVAAVITPWARRPVTTAPSPAGTLGQDDESADPWPVDTGLADPTSSAPGSPGSPDVPPRVRRLGWLALAAVAGVAAWSTAPRLHQSVWGDESRTLREFIVGQFHTDAQGVRTYDEATWGDAFFNFRTPNNHVLYSLAARTSHLALSRPPLDAGDAYFSEWAMRLPAWLVALASVFSLAGLGAVMGWRRAGWIAAVLLVVHPGFVRYAAEARGYAFLLAGTPLLLLALARAVQTGRWRWWTLAAVLDFALIYTWPLSLHFVAIANGGAVAAVMFNRRRPMRDRGTLLLRWTLTALFAAAAWVQLFLPNLIQLRFWLRGSSSQGVAGDGGWVDALGVLFSGRVWHEADASNPLLTPWVRTWQTAPWIVGVAGLGMLTLLLAGSVAAWRRSPWMRPWLPAIWLPPATLLLQTGLSGSVLYPWYLIFAVPGVLLVLAIGLDDIVHRLPGPAMVKGAAVAAAVAGFAAMNATTRSHLRRHPIEPNREASLLAQPVINPHHPDYQRHVLTGAFIMRNSIYDPGVRSFANTEEMRGLMAEAQRTGRDFVVIYGQRELARQAFPEVMALLDDPGEFQPVATLYGQEAYCTRYIVRRLAAP